MELIKKIKQTEQQAQQIIEKAKADAAGQAEELRQHRRKLLEQAEQQRKKTIEASVAEARRHAKADIEKLKARADADRKTLREKANAKMTAAVAKVMDYIKG
jgi:V/A-type H+-transporting ATPase subunit G/H